MPYYITRIELHGAVSKDYTDLHGHMMDLGFTTIVTADDGLSYYLPPAEYLFYTIVEFDASRIRDMAREAANRTGKASAIFTSKTYHMAWVGLEPV